MPGCPWNRRSCRPDTRVCSAANPLRILLVELQVASARFAWPVNLQARRQANRRQQQMNNDGNKAAGQKVSGHGWGMVGLRVEGGSCFLSLH